MQNNIEVELRGPLATSLRGKQISRDQFLEILKNENAVQTATENRILIDYSTPLEGLAGRKLDVRLRCTNDQAEIVVKKGSMDKAAREEAIVKLKSGEVEHGLQLLSLLGYKEGVACDRRIMRYQVGEIEIAIQEVRYFDQPEKIQSYFYEAEIMANPSNQQEQLVVLQKWLEERGIPIFEGSEWNEYVQGLNDEVNGLYVHGTDKVDLITRHISKP